MKQPAVAAAAAAAYSVHYNDGDGASSAPVNDWQRSRAEKLKIEVRASPGDPCRDVSC